MGGPEAYGTRSAGDALRHARQLIRCVKPENVRKVLRHERYWTPEFLRLFLARCDRLRLLDPEAARRLIGPLADLTERVTFPSRAVGRSFRLCGVSLAAEVFELTGDRTRADSEARKAEGLMTGAKVHQIAAADFFRHQGAVARLRGHGNRADAFLDRSVSLYRGSAGQGEAHGLAEALMLRGRLGSPSAVVELAESLAWVRPDLKDPFRNALFDGIWWLLHRRVSGRAGADALQACLGWIRAANRKWYLHRKTSARRVRLIWTEGRILARLGMDALAAKRLHRARKRAARLDLPEVVALVVLDLASILVGQNDLDGFHALLDEAGPQVRSRQALPDLLDRARQSDGLQDLDRLWTEAAGHLQPPLLFRDSPTHQ